MSMDDDFVGCFCWAVAIGGGVLLLMVVLQTPWMWRFLLVGLVTVLCFYIYDKRRKKENKRQQEETINNLRTEIAGLLTESLFIDSNIWMMDDEKWFKVSPAVFHDSQYLFSDILPRVCREKDYVIMLPSWQFDEICNVNNKSKYDDVSGRNSRIAIGRIEELQKEGLLRIENITLNAERAYADPLIIEEAIKAVKAGRNSTVVTNDKELRIRLRQLLTDTGLDNWKIVDLLPSA